MVVYRCKVTAKEKMHMDDRKIIELYWSRDEKALSETKIRQLLSCGGV